MVSPAYTSRLEGTPNELKMKYFADNDFAELSGDELADAMKEQIRKKDSNLVGNMKSQGTTPRRLTTSSAPVRPRQRRWRQGNARCLNPGLFQQFRERIKEIPSVEGGSSVDILVAVKDSVKRLTACLLSAVLFICSLFMPNLVPPEITLPPEHPMNTRAARPDTYAATDALGRELPGNETTGDAREGRFVGLFYWTWHVAHAKKRSCSRQRQQDRYGVSVRGQ